MRGNAALGSVDVAHHGFDAAVEGCDGCGERGVGPRRAFRLHALRAIAHKVIELFGNIVEALFECVGPRLLARRAASVGLIGAIADRLFQPFADGEPGASRGIAGRGPSLALYGINAPGHACGHGQFRSRIDRGNTCKRAWERTVHNHGKWLVNFSYRRSICWEALGQGPIDGPEGRGLLPASI